MRLVLTHGCFDILHPGHLYHLKASRLLGDMLIVSVTADEFVNKGLGKPRITLSKRMAMLREFRCVDFVLPSYDWRPDRVIETLRPNIYTKHKEYEGMLPEKELVEKYGGHVVFISDEKVYSSRDLCAS